MDAPKAKEGVRITVRTFHGDTDSYDQWRERFNGYLFTRKWGWIGGIAGTFKSQSKPTDNVEAAEAEIEAYYTIFAAMTDTVSEEMELNITEKTGTAALAWIDKRYKKTGHFSKAIILEEIVTAKYEEGTNLKEHLIKMQTLFAKYNSDKKFLMDSGQMAIMLLRTLPPTFDAYRRERYTRAELKLQDVVEDLMNLAKLETSSNIKTPTSTTKEPTLKEESLLFSSERNLKNATCNRCGKKGHFRSGCKVLFKDLVGSFKKKEIEELKRLGVPVTIIEDASYVEEDEDPQVQYENFNAEISELNLNQRRGNKSKVRHAGSSQRRAVNQIEEDSFDANLNM
jgi:hypothetical protein